MTRTSSFWRKVTYLCAIAVLFVPLSMLSAPGKSSETGGVLTRMRHDERLSQGQLGKIDPASASMSLATLGMRGVAANQLWTQAQKYKRTENWDAFKATLNQISKLQPNFVSVWQFQAWNISYNVSVEFDDYRHRYHWVKKGVDYLLEGSEYNRNDPQLLWDTGWFFGHKIGRSDDHRQFRRLFRDDTDFHEKLPIDFDNVDNQGPDGKPDNWKAAHEFYSRGERAVDSGARLKSLTLGHWVGEQRIIGKKETPLKGKSPLVYHSDPPKALIKYANAIEEDGYLNEVAQLAWEEAQRAWEGYGQRPIMSSFGVKIQLGNLDENQQLADTANKRLAELTPGVREGVEKQRQAQLSEEQAEAMATSVGKRTPKQSEAAFEAGKILEVTHLDVADAAPREVREEARQWARKAQDAEEQVRIIQRYREIVNYVYWLKRCQAEQEDNTVAARIKLREADQLFSEAELEPAKEAYEEAWDLWSDVFQRYDVLIDDVEGEVVFESVERYRKLLGQLDEVFPPPGFKLQPLVDHYAEIFYALDPSRNNPPTKPTGETGVDESGEVATDKPSDGAAESGDDSTDQAAPEKAEDDASDPADPPATESPAEEEPAAAGPAAGEPEESTSDGSAVSVPSDVGIELVDDLPQIALRSPTTKPSRHA